MLKVQINAIAMECEPGTTFLDLLGSLPDGGKGALGASVEGRTLSLNAPVHDGVSAWILTFKNEEGRRIYERTLQFVLLAAARRVLGEARVRIEHSFGQGLFVRLPGTTVTPGLVAQIEREMRQIVAADLPMPLVETTKR